MQEKLNLLEARGSHFDELNMKILLRIKEEKIIDPHSDYNLS